MDFFYTPSYLQLAEAAHVISPGIMGKNLGLCVKRGLLMCSELRAPSAHENMHMCCLWFVFLTVRMAEW